MKSKVLLGLGSLFLVLASSALAGCGADEKKEPNRTREAMPFVGLKLKNMTPPGGHGATATATGSAAGRSASPITAGPAAPGQTATNTTPGTSSADSVELNVSFMGGPTYRGSGSYPGSFIGSIDIQCSEPSGGTATVTFASGQPSQSIPLSR